MIQKILKNIPCSKLQKNKLYIMYFSQINPLQNSKFQNNTLHNDKFQNNTLQNEKFRNNTLQNEKFQNNTLQNEKFQNNTLQNEKFQKYKIILTTLFVTVCLGGCGKASKEDDAFAAFSDSVTNFSNVLKEADTQLNGLDVTSEGAADQMLEILDNLDNEFAQFAALSVPEDTQYQSIETLADEASQNMSDAVSHYHAAFESEAYSAYDADLAYQYYIRAMERVEYIGHLLSGNEIPENDHVTVHEESNDKEILDKILPDEIE